MTDIPKIETERLHLRPATMADWPDYCALMESDRACFMGGPHSRQNAWGMFCNDVAQWNLFGHGALMFDLKDSGESLGQVAINAGPMFPEHEIGWLVYPHVEGKGYAFEAATAMRDWAFTALNLSTLVSYIDPENHRSIKLAERLGAKRDDNARRPEPATLVYRHPRP